MPLEQEIIANYLNHPLLPTANILVFDELPSTNSYLLEIVKNNKSFPLACFTEFQSSGRGQLGKRWYSANNSSICCSLSWGFKTAPPGNLSLAVAVMVANALQAIGVSRKITLKWPNDVLWKNQKLAGILIENQIVDNQCFSIIGVGINLAVPKNIGYLIDQPWCDLATILSPLPNKNFIASSLLNCLITGLTAYQASGFNAFADCWRALDHTKNLKITITTALKKITGLAVGIDNLGNYLVKTGKHQVISFSSGTISLIESNSLSPLNLSKTL